MPSDDPIIREMLEAKTRQPCGYVVGPADGWRISAVLYFDRFPSPAAAMAAARRIAACPELAGGTPGAEDWRDVVIPVLNVDDPIDQATELRRMVREGGDHV